MIKEGKITCTNCKKDILARKFKDHLDHCNYINIPRTGPINTNNVSNIKTDKNEGGYIIDCLEIATKISNKTSNYERSEIILLGLYMGYQH